MINIKNKKVLQKIAAYINKIIFRIYVKFYTNIEILDEIFPYTPE